MAAGLRYVDPSHRPGPVRRAYAALANTRPLRAFSRAVVWKLDPYVLRATRGRVGLGALLPSALLETTGAKSGEPRRNGVLYFHDRDDVIIVASRQGDSRHPAWFHNLVANPDVVLGGQPMRATVVTDEAERERLWGLADRVFAPYASYRREAARAGRVIPIVRLTPRYEEA